MAALRNLAIIASSFIALICNALNCSNKAAKNEKMYSLINSTHVGFPPAWCQCQYSQLFFLCHNKIYARCNVKDLSDSLIHSLFIQTIDYSDDAELEKNGVAPTVERSAV